MRKRGFTFIELMVVWSIIAILAAILFPVFARARAKAQQCNCLRNLQNIGIALRVYAQDNYGHFPVTNNDLSALVPVPLPDRQVFICPGSRDPLGNVPPGTIPPPPEPGRMDYVYWGGACDDDRPTFALAADDVVTRHNQGANYLWVDGHTKWAPRSSSTPDEKDTAVQSAVLQEAGFDQLQRLREMKPGYVAPPKIESDSGVRM
ncbi:MAG TPA: prepilin-type N-terminal cleavage/methylation domain-containing protein [Armatimonadota bacterium]|jgi:prepilin-type N-terminal cleavage/methylation domain-containing protein/prepilin-type processing-associated H-X9-DG protein